MSFKFEPVQRKASGGKGRLTSPDHLRVSMYNKSRDSRPTLRIGWGSSIQKLFGQLPRKKDDLLFVRVSFGRDGDKGAILLQPADSSMRNQDGVTGARHTSPTSLVETSVAAIPPWLTREVLHSVVLPWTIDHEAQGIVVELPPEFVRDYVHETAGKNDEPPAAAPQQKSGKFMAAHSVPPDDATDTYHPTRATVAGGISKAKETGGPMSLAQRLRLRQ